MMMMMFYAGGQVLTSERVVNAVLGYANALANNGKADVVTIPALVNEQRRYARLIIGPASQITCVPAEQEGVQLEDEAAVEEMLNSAAGLGAKRPVWDSDSSRLVETLHEYDFLD